MDPGYTKAIERIAQAAAQRDAMDDEFEVGMSATPGAPYGPTDLALPYRKPLNANGELCGRFLAPRLATMSSTRFGQIDRTLWTTCLGTPNDIISRQNAQRVSRRR